MFDGKYKSSASASGIQLYRFYFYRFYKFYKLITYQTKAGSGSCSTIMNPNATKIRAKFTKIKRQQTPLVLGQNYKYINENIIDMFIVKFR